MPWIDELEAAVHSADPARCRRLLQGRTEPERKEAASRALELCRQYLRIEDLGGGRYRRKIEQASVAAIALLGTAGLAQLKKSFFPSTYPTYPVLADRNPEWLAEWAESTFEREAQPFFRDIRRLIRDGLIPKPTSGNYIVAFIGSLTEPLEQLIAREPDLLDYEIWRIFEVEGNSKTSLANHDKFLGNWAEGLATLAAKGILPRARLLDASLDALERDFAPFRAVWFSAFHERLKPDAAEREQRAARYLALLGSRVPTTVSFAIKAAAKLERAKKLDPAAAVPAVATALSARQKGVVAEALKVLASLHKRAPEQAPAIASAVVPALAHESLEVQKLAVDLMQACTGDQAASLARGYEDLLAPTQRLRLGIELETPALQASPTAGPFPISPIRDLDELVEVFAKVMENAGPPDDIERVLDGVARFCADRTPRFAALTAPLAARAAEFLNSPSIWPVAGHFDARFDSRYSLCALALAWIKAEPVKPSRACHGVCSFLTARVAEVAIRAANSSAKPLAALPSHTESWIHPLVLVERLHHYPEPDRLDLIQALLRLSPDDRDQALEQARSLPGPTGRIVRFALGSGDCRRPPRFFDEALWEAAGQARDPEGGAGVHGLRWSLRSTEVGGNAYHYTEVEMESWPRPQMDADKPAALTAIPGTQDAAMLRWCSTVWPAHREPWFAAGALALARNLDWSSAEWANRVYLETLAAYRGPYGPMADQLLALGLSCKEVGESLAATDALLAAFIDGRMNGEKLGRVCARLATQGSVAIHRWVKRFAAVSHLYPTFHGALFRVMDDLLAARASIKPKELSAFLELLYELQTATGQPLTSEAREHLTFLSPGGKAGKFAAKLR